MRIGLLFVLIAIACGCNSPPAFPVPGGPPQQVALDVQLPVYVLGRWTIDGFSETLRAELAKYNITVVDRRVAPRFVALIDLGHWNDHTVIDVDLTSDGQTARVGRVRVPDLAMTTLDVAAQLIAEIVARSVWSKGAGRSRVEVGWGRAFASNTQPQRMDWRRR